MRNNMIASRCWRFASRYWRMAGVAAGGGGKVVTGNGADSGEYNIAVMVVLALETVTSLGSVAVWRDGTCMSRAIAAGSGTGTHTGDSVTPHAVSLPGAWMSALVDAGLRLDDVDRLVVVSGPGSFTGVRIGMASAQGLALTRGWSVMAVPTLDAMAECWRASHEDAGARVVIACLDGLRGEVFAREFRFDHAAMEANGDAIVTTPDRLTWTPFGGGASLVGNGAVKYADAFRSRADDITDVPEPIAAGAARLAARGAVAQVSPHALRPLYVRRPDVELARERGQSNVC
ncbi:MAG TPA: tRNA (adenosine(37)-N6)-threonylcarbamoyltransferase complex dimerization subunit type 1 TsaB [Vicinamibacterales bacterium]|nr:tRNA (adenosine(37)-N6)-threonylcarbamoyltransferase complex dimerization subunit type 1 TsaB [Vicinamibacterales bacterium]